MDRDKDSVLILYYVSGNEPDPSTQRFTNELGKLKKEATPFSDYLKRVRSGIEEKEVANEVALLSFITSVSESVSQ